MTIKHMEQLELSEPISFADVEQFVEMGKSLGIKGDALVLVRHYPTRGGAHKSDLTVGLVNGVS